MSKYNIQYKIEIVVHEEVQADSLTDAAQKAEELSVTEGYVEQLVKPANKNVCWEYTYMEAEGIWGTE